MWMLEAFDPILDKMMDLMIDVFFPLWIALWVTIFTLAFKAGVWMAKKAWAFYKSRRGIVDVNPASKLGS